MNEFYLTALIVQKKRPVRRRIFIFHKSIIIDRICGLMKIITLAKDSINEVFLYMKGRGEFPNLNQKRADGFKANGKSYRVMVVEDNEFQRKLIVQILESEGYEVVATATNGSEAIQKFNKIEGGVDLLTTDLDMPILDGYALLYELNQKPNKPLVVFISEDTTKGVMTDLITMGIGDFILKPIQRRTLLDRVKAAMNKKSI